MDYWVSLPPNKLAVRGCLAKSSVYVCARNLFHDEATMHRVRVTSMQTKWQLGVHYLTISLLLQDIADLCARAHRRRIACAEDCSSHHRSVRGHPQAVCARGRAKARDVGGRVHRAHGSLRGRGDFAALAPRGLETQKNTFE
eukprot:2418906-Amphidinium_carterae.1